jgi:hypothetical protein
MKVAWPVIIETAGKIFHRQTIDVSPIGAKVRLDQVLPVGAAATLRIDPPDGRRLDVDAIVWRADADGPAFFFIGLEHTGALTPPQ